MTWGTRSSTLQGSSIPADSNTQIIPEFRFVRRMGGGEAPVQDFLEDATAQSFTVGQCVRLTVDGTIEECEADDDHILGIANRAAGGSGTIIPVTLALQDVIFEATVTTPANLVAAMVGDTVPLDVTAGVHTVDENDPDAAHPFKIIGLPTGATDSTHVNFGKVYVQIAASQVGQDAEAAQTGH